MSDAGLITVTRLRTRHGRAATAGRSTTKPALFCYPSALSPPIDRQQKLTADPQADPVKAACLFERVQNQLDVAPLLRKGVPGGDDPAAIRGAVCRHYPVASGTEKNGNKSSCILSRQ